ncbi:hypothetical protein [Texcoconibacillus texcoconensis]|uniref:Uncharacterized protein n=1 Tax=Texcoconibacillus texcoconensis TaxID=1095777 RepID=A0A840QNZ6_9BACI|nr:hypothetical protein [Texcoconibacillus texcoconensis]MBB5173090.1 hypothetical protein [Texcoconibacillus texcoconensis]
MDLNSTVFTEFYTNTSVTNVITSHFPLLFTIGLLYWSINRTVGFHLLLISSFSLSLSLLFHQYVPLIYTNNTTVTFTHPHIQLVTALFAYFIPLIRNKRQLLLTLSPIVLISFFFFFLAETHVYTIAGSVVIGGFIIYMFYRSFDWIEGMPEKTFIFLTLLIPSALISLIYPLTSAMIYPGILFGASIGYSLERLKVRSIINGASLINRCIAFFIGSAGVIAIYFVFRLPFVQLPFFSFTFGTIVTLWITFIAPYMFYALHLYSREGSIRHIT